MHTFGFRSRRLLSVAVLPAVLTAYCAAAAAAPASDPVGQENAAMAKEIDQAMSMAFRLSKDLKLDPALRADAEAIAGAHLARLRALTPVWLQEERRLQARPDGTAPSAPVFYAVFSRMLNDMAVWQVAPADTAYEKATLDAIRATPAVCQAEGGLHRHDFASHVLRLQAMPPAQRLAALDSERRALEDWDKPHALLPPWPDPLPRTAAMEAVERIRTGGPRPPQALPPTLASSLLAKRMRYEDLAWEEKCLLQRWWLDVSLAQGRSPAEVLAAFRYGTLISAAERFGRAFEAQDQAQDDAQDEAPAKIDPAAPPRYPKLAARFDVTGTTRISRRYDAAGKPVQASVVERRIKVNGIRGTRPVAFEDAFDAVAVQYALAGGGATEVVPGGSAVFEMVWALDGAGAGANEDANKDAKPQGAGQ